jgi:hypothetical protein
MEINSNTIHITSLLPPTLQIPSAGSHLYQRGLSLYQLGGAKRHKFYNPYFVLSLNLIYFCRSFYALLTPIENRDIFIYLGDYPYFLNAKIHLNIAATQYYLLSITPQLLNFWMYYKNIYPTYLRPFAMMSGSVTPKSIGLTKREDIQKLISRSKICFFIANLNTIAVLIVSFFLSFLPIIMKLDLKQSLLFGIPWSLLFAVSSHYTFCSHVWNLTYFYLICQYLKFKVRNINTTIELYTKRCNIGKENLKQILETSISIHSEIHEYNKIYWSKFAVILLVFFVTFMNTVLFLVLFNEMHIILKLSLTYAFFLSFAIITFFLKIGSSVNHEVNKSYKLLNKLSIAFFGRIKIVMQIKVKIIKSKYNFSVPQ